MMTRFAPLVFVFVCGSSVGWLIREQPRHKPIEPPTISPHETLVVVVSTVGDGGSMKAYQLTPYSIGHGFKSELIGKPGDVGDEVWSLTCGQNHVCYRREK
jgi:hypothetical protein